MGANCEVKQKLVDDYIEAILKEKGRQYADAVMIGLEWKCTAKDHIRSMASQIPVVRRLNDIVANALGSICANNNFDADELTRVVDKFYDYTEEIEAKHPCSHEEYKIHNSFGETNDTQH